MYLEILDYNHQNKIVFNNTYIYIVIYYLNLIYYLLGIMYTFKDAISDIKERSRYKISI